MVFWSWITGVGVWGFGVSLGVKFLGGLGEVMFGFLLEKF